MSPPTMLCHIRGKLGASVGVIATVEQELGEDNPEKVREALARLSYACDNVVAVGHEYLSSLARSRGLMPGQHLVTTTDRLIRVTPYTTVRILLSVLMSCYTYWDEPEVYFLRPLMKVLEEALEPVCAA